jgi:nicotinate-nucleotide adenylyltransferase
VPERLGILGGTFDPVHVGHIVAAVQVRADQGLDRVLMVPAGDPWQKRGLVVASAEQRLAMVEIACRGLPGVEASRVEVDADGPSVTADTLERLAAPEREISLLLGADAAAARRDAGPRRDRGDRTHR